MTGYNVILLNHFYGHPALMDECSNNIRYAQLLNIIDRFPQNNTIFFSNLWYNSTVKTFSRDERLLSIKAIAEIENFKWIEYEDEDSIKNLIDKTLIKISPSNTNVIVGGTNTTGCVLRNTNVSAKNWTDLDFNVQICLSMCADYQICLSMCADYQISSVTPADKNQMAAALLYQYIKDNDMIDRVDLIYHVKDLKMRSVL